MSGTVSALGQQHGGGHYLSRKIQPVEFWADRKWDAFSGSILKYLTRWRDKGGLVDLEKSLHFAELRMQLKAGFTVPKASSCKYTMGQYIKANDLGLAEDAILYALDAWVSDGKGGNNPLNSNYMAFHRLMTLFIEEVKKWPTPTMSPKTP